MIKKSAYRESDYLVTLFTRRHGKVKVLARSAKKSQRRFGGRLEPFLVLSVDISFNKDRFNVLNDITLLNSYSNIMESVESFLFANFVLEHVDMFVHEGQPSEELFGETIKAFEQMNKGCSLLPAMLNFQLSLLRESGIRPDFDGCSTDAVLFDITNGSLYNKKEKTENERYRLFHADIVVKPELMEIFLGKVTCNIRVLTGYIENYVEKKFKSSAFIKDITL